MYWLLHTRRVPHNPYKGAERADEDVVTEHTKLCAGTGIEERPAWICKTCIRGLCRHGPVMPYLALANWNWGGRMHPAFQNLSIAMRLLQCLGRPLV